MVFLIVIAILLHQAALYVRYRRLDILNFYSFIDASLLLTIFFGVIRNPPLMERFNEEPIRVFAVLLGVMGLYAGLHWPLRKATTKPRPMAELIQGIDTRWLWLGYFAHMAVMVSFIYDKMRLAGLDFWTYFSSERLSTALSGHIVAHRLPYDAMMACTLGAALLLLTVKLEQRSWPVAAFIYLSILGSIVACFVTRFAVLLTLSYPLAYYHYRIRRLRLFMCVLALAGGIMVLMMLDIWRGAGLDAVFHQPFSYSSERALAHMQRDANSIEMFNWLMDEYLSDRLELEYGLNYAYGIITFYPRMLWPDKPLTAFEGRWTEKYTGKIIGTGVPILTFTAFGEGLVQFGILGIFLNLFLYGLVVSYARRLVVGNELLYLAAYHFSVLSGVFLRSGWQSIFVLFLTYLVPVLVFYKLATRRAAKAALASAEPPFSRDRFARLPVR